MNDPICDDTDLGMTIAEHAARYHAQRCGCPDVYSGDVWHHVEPYRCEECRLDVLIECPPWCVG